MSALGTDAIRQAIVAEEVLEAAARPGDIRSLHRRHSRRKREWPSCTVSG
jgi:hypothetical protein